MVNDMNKTELELKCEDVYREVAKNVLEKIKLQMDVYIRYINIQGYDTKENLKRTLTSVISKAYREFEVEFEKKVDESLNEQERMLIDKHIKLYHIAIKKAFDGFVDVVMNMVR